LRLSWSLSEVKGDKARARLTAEAFDALEAGFPQLADLTTQGHIRDGRLRLQKETAEMLPDPAIETFAREAKRRIGPSLQEMTLFGSRARGDARQTSDYDVLVIVDEKTPEIRDQLLDIEVEILDRYQALVASVLRSADEWRRSEGYPLAINIRREGIRL
jgi:predicted nucleotidyltransferase